MTATRALGTRIQIGATYIAELTEIGGLDLSADTIETTTLDSTGGFRNFIQGFKDAGEVSLSGYFNPGDGGQSAMYTAFNGGTTDSYTILFPSGMGASWAFSGVVTGFKTGATLEDGISWEATIKVSGQPTLGLTASANLTGLTGTGTGGTFSPAFAGGTYSYSYSFTGASTTFTATLAGATYDVFLDNTLFQAGVASGAACNAIAFSAVGSKKVTVVERETGKTPKTYDIVAIRTA